MLRRVEPLRHIEVVYDNPVRAAIAPHDAVIKGLVSLYGHTHAFETGVDLRQFRSEFDVFQLAKVLVASFEEAAKKVATEK